MYRQIIRALISLCCLGSVFLLSDCAHPTGASLPNETLQAQQFVDQNGSVNYRYCQHCLKQCDLFSLNHIKKGNRKNNQTNHHTVIKNVKSTRSNTHVN